MRYILESRKMDDIKNLNTNVHKFNIENETRL